MNGRNQILSLIAAITMLIDHIGGIFFPSALWLRVIGRISFPLFAYGIAQGVKHTSDFKKYEMRILLMAVISQPICMMAFGRVESNPIWALAYGALVLWLWQEGRKLWFVGMLGLSFFLSFEYGAYGVLTIFLFGVLDGRTLDLGQLALQGYSIPFGDWLQPFALLALPLLHKEWQIEVKLPKYALYVFYPAHLLVLVAVRRWM